jgi:WD40 repeat protein
MRRIRHGLVVATLLSGACIACGGARGGGWSSEPLAPRAPAEVSVATRRCRATRARPPEPPPAATDVHGDPLPAKAIARLGSLRFFHRGGARGLTLLDRGRRLVSVGARAGGRADPERGAVRLWDASTGQRLALERAPEVVSVAASERSCVAIASRREGVRLWDAGALAYASDPIFGPSAVDASAVAITASADRVFLGYDDGRIATWDVDRGEAIGEFRVDDDAVVALAVSPDGTRLAAATDFHGVVLWTGSAAPRTLRTSTDDAIGAVAFSPDGRTIGALSEHGILATFDAASGRRLQEAPAPTPSSRSIAVTAFDDGRGRGVAHDGGGHAVVVDQRGELLLRLAVPEVESALFAGRTLFLGTTAGEIRQVDLEDRRAASPTGHQETVASIAFLSRGLASADQAGELRIWDLGTQRTERRLLEDRSVSHLALTGDRSHLAVIVDLNEYLRLTTAGLAIASRTRPAAGLFANRCCAIAAPSDGSYLALPDERGVDLLSAARKPSKLTRLPGRFEEVQALCAGSRGWLAAGTSVSSADAFGVSIWKGRGAPPLRVRPHREPLEFCAFAADDKRLITATRSEVAVIDVPSRSILSTFETRFDAFAYALSDDGRRLAAGNVDGEIRVWEPTKGAEIASLGGHDGGVEALAWSADGALLASGGADHVVLVFEIPK